MDLHVLIVDDDSTDREAIKRFLNRPGRAVSVQMVSTGWEALDLLREKKFDCIFLDYRLPDMDGISLLRQVYDPETDLTMAPVIMLTGEGNEAVMADALRWGAQDYVLKDNISTDTLYITMSKAREMFELKKSRHQAEEQMRQSQKMEAVGRLTSGVAHDFNNLLSVILGNTRLLQKGLAGEGRKSAPEELLKKVEAVENAARRGAELVRRLMVFTRQHPPETAPVDINACVSGTAELVSRSLSGMIETLLLPGADIWPVEADAGQLENAIINIALNARDAMPRGGRLTIETHNIVVDEEYAALQPEMSPGGYVMIALSDTGCGMPLSVQQRIFEPFFTTRENGGGTGLGLSMVYGFVRQAGGYIHVYSEVGHGTVFRIYLPRVAAEAGSVSTVNDNRTEEALRGSETILVVEDDPQFARMAEKMLDRLGYRVLHAASGRSAMEVLKREHRGIDLLFTDIVMPGGINGIDLARKARESYPHLRTLYTSGYTESAVPDYQLLVGQHIIGKPYRKEVLARKIRDTLDGRGEGVLPPVAKAVNTGD